MLQGDGDGSQTVILWDAETDFAVGAKLEEQVKRLRRSPGVAFQVE
jgi:hypothetical protein